MQTQELVTIMSNADNLDLDNSGTRQNTRYMFGRKSKNQNIRMKTENVQLSVMGTDFIGYPNNVTKVLKISDAFNSLNSRIPFPPIFINYTA